MSVVAGIVDYINTSPKRKVNLMAHELESDKSFASFREPAWHGLGTVFHEEVSTKEMLELANLHEWNVHLEEIATPQGFSSDKTYNYVTRTNPFDRSQKDILGVVGERYRILQNEELFDFGDALLDGGRWETAGSVKGGRQVFGSLALERETVLDPTGVSDKVSSYLLVNTSHDGSIAIQASVTPVRVVCANTLNLALGSGIGRNRKIKQSYKIRHTQTAGGKIQAAREALGLANIYLDEFDKVAKEMIEQTVTQDKFMEIVNAVYPMPELDKKGARSKWSNKIDKIEEIYKGEYNNTIAGTAWGVLNGLTERLDWHRSPRGSKGNESILASASGFDPMMNAEKNRILNTVRQLTTV
jgi:phage/plasmid-like protein (TIGR03299 family)